MNLLIKNVNLLSMEEDKVLEGVNVYVEGDTIKHIGELLPDVKVDVVIEGKDKLAMPGLINAHTHLGMSLFRNYANDVPLFDWLTKYIWPLEARLTAEDVYWGSLLSMIEMIYSGTTTYCDMYFFMEEVAKATEEIGIRGVISRGIIEEQDAKVNEEKLKDTENLYNAWNGKAEGRIKVMVGPHAPYTCGPTYLKEILDLAKRLGTGIHIHVSETKREVEESLEKYGKTPVQHLKDLGIFEVPTVAAHCVHLTDEDIEVLKEMKVSPVYNPTSNLKLASGFAPVEKMLKKGINVALGTDGPASNNNLNMFEEIHFAATINKALNEDALSVPAFEALKMATVSGARALLWEREIGTIEVGKKADVILIDLNKPHLHPKNDLISALAYSVQGSDVDTVIVNGKVIMEKREIKTVDVERVYYEVEKRAQNLIRGEIS
ncbi:5-methylthioadenosine/S-adenosylhomocysteine deaminase [Caldanaerobacter subterraneus subsp. tengcongensis MB4]|uniref:5-methylthioadenosine/S-adenosylhomocysteine deaminase n=3 Tax=Caldanaerobacter subterraneus TaxID=911092 RepID=MTAD_CALS4|nr:amidohydrolase [Caldanaerobacter subterraneus]Q8R9L4.1 RecName: Full=5-methylthioadenosine/S-adenosylhomocysteine deaminase; Short=MTA/SAH deaminase [Caldanaerobacter subterraneus subsp. tengcongensis MB4]AAM24797.1 Cytosine deaminase and related metal-dependent hydrolases [Caldanaerobacter subterraneus subsp. tengcongensis MB4]ERM92855.1 N-ethylammeline chlorohydrolase [Caldanaerobacter subterraneus subsp. yonseiensis KB-1]KKC29469.1 cytosine deaminase-like protein [Caldanaerobacter subterr